MDLAEVIVVIGGCDRKGLLQLPFADSYHPESRRWTPLPSLPGYPRSEFAACALRNDIYISGEGTILVGCWEQGFPPKGPELDIGVMLLLSCQDSLVSLLVLPWSPHYNYDSI